MKTLMTMFWLIFNSQFYIHKILDKMDILGDFQCPLKLKINYPNKNKSGYFMADTNQ